MLDPFRGFSDMQSQMNRMFDQMLGNFARRPEWQLEGVTEWAPAKKRPSGKGVRTAAWPLLLCGLTVRSAQGGKLKGG